MNVAKRMLFLATMALCSIEIDSFAPKHTIMRRTQRVMSSAHNDIFFLNDTTPPPEISFLPTESILPSSFQPLLMAQQALAKIQSSSPIVSSKAGSLMTMAAAVSCMFGMSSSASLEQYVPSSEGALFEVEVLNDLSHVTLDLVTLLGAPSTALAVRFLAVLGRVFVMTADYLPDHAIAPDELMFQITMLYLASSNLTKSFLKVALASMGPSAKRMTLRDGRAFSSLFKPAGVTWSQYKALANVALEWVSVEEGESVQVSDSAVFWLCKGQLTVQGDSPPLQYTVTRTLPSKENAGKGLLGDLAMLQRLDKAKSQKTRGHKKPAFGPQDTDNVDSKNKNNKTSSKTASNMTAKAGPQGALMLRIDTARLLDWMHEYDEKLEQPMRNLLFMGIQEKLSTTPENERQD